MNKPINLAAIDIGSNGARLLIKRFDCDPASLQSIRKVLFLRIPLRLGRDVFTLGKISKQRFKMMLHMMKAFEELMELYEVKEYWACATSAMRDAENGAKVLKAIEKECGIKLKIIPGSEEARLLCNNLLEHTETSVGNYAYVDVGGGSTEISLLHDGILAESHSFNVGTLRMLGGQVAPEEWENMKRLLADYAREFYSIRIVGSGGNINRLYKMVREKGTGKTLPVEQLRDVYEKLAPLSVEERQQTYGLKDDRADVIVRAAEIFLTVAQSLQCNEIMVPNISLADCIVDGLYRSLIL